jgi:hypothetical protein
VKRNVVVGEAGASEPRDAGGEVEAIVILDDESLKASGCRNGLGGCDEGGVEAAQLAVVGADVVVQLPADPGVDGEVRSQLDVVLQEDRHRGSAIALVVGALLATAGVEVAELSVVLRRAHDEQEVLKGLEVDAATLVVRIVEVELVLFAEEASAEALLTVGSGDLIADLEGVHGGEGDVIIDATEVEVAGCGDNGRKRISRMARRGHADLIEGKVRLRLERTDAADVADERFVQEVGALGLR